MKWLLLFLLFIPFVGFSQKFEGKITYKLSYTSDLESSLQGLPTQVTEYIKGPHLRTNQSTNLGNQSSIYNSTDSSYILLVEFVDKKIAIRMPKEYAQGTGKNVPEIKYKCKKKKIAGYKCKLAIVTYKDLDPIEVWYTKKIPSSLNHKIEGLKGYPLSFTLFLRDAVQFQVAESIDTAPVKDEQFSIPADYEEMTMDEFQKSLGY